MKKREILINKLMSLPDGRKLIMFKKLKKHKGSLEEFIRQYNIKI